MLFLGRGQTREVFRCLNVSRYLTIRSELDEELQL